MKLKIIYVLLGVFLVSAFAFGFFYLSPKEIQKKPKVQTQDDSIDFQSPEGQIGKQESFEATVEEVLENKESSDFFGQKQIFQKLKLKGLDGNYKDKEIVVDGNATQNASKVEYKKNDKVTVSHDTTNGRDFYIVTDYVRYPWIYLLFVFFVAAVIVAGRKRGLFALLGLGFSFFIILNFLIPSIVSGNDPLLVAIFSASIILVVSIYLAHGLNKKSTIAISGTILGVIAVGILSAIFTGLLRFTGVSSEEALFLNLFADQHISLTSLLLAGIILSAVGFLNDVAITQSSTVKELKEANPELKVKELYKRGMKVGRDHFASTVNTLFLAYAGASITLLLLFTFMQPPFDSLGRILNNEMVATEIMRTLIGSMGIILAIPITTLIASYFYSSGKDWNFSFKSLKELIKNKK